MCRKTRAVSDSVTLVGSCKSHQAIFADYRNFTPAQSNQPLFLEALEVAGNYLPCCAELDREILMSNARGTPPTDRQQRLGKAHIYRREYQLMNPGNHIAEAA